MIDRLEHAGSELVFQQRQAVLLEGPAALRDNTQRVDIVGRELRGEQRPIRGELPNPGTADHVVAEIAERVDYPLAGQRNVRICVHAQEEDSHAHRYPAFVIKREERVVGDDGVPTCQGIEDRRNPARFAFPEG